MSIGILVYMNTDSIDGIHARKTKQTSIIGEYFDHLGDLIVMSFIGNYLSNMVGFQYNLPVKNMIMILSSMNFIKHHWDAVDKCKMIFTEFTDITLILTIISLLVFINYRLPNILINYCWTIPILCGIPILYQLIKIYNTQYTDINLEYFKFIYFVYWIIKLFMGFINPINFTWILPLMDLPILLDIINLKIFKRTFVNPYVLLLLPIISSLKYYNFIGVIFVIGYLIYFINNITSQLKINLFLNPPSVYLPRVYCCGVFDLCHLGHMKMFEKIVKSFDYPIWLIVGVHSDKTVTGYKREPIINEKFRVESVKLCKFVNEVWEDAELTVTKDFCIDNNIDVVIIGEEYKGNKDIIWYKGGMELGIHKYISRFEELSTTDIIKRIKLHE